VLRLICAVLGWSLEERSSSAPVQNPEARFSSVRPCDHVDTKPCEVTRRVAAGYPYLLLESRRDLQLAKTSFVASPNPFREQAADWQKLDPNEAFWRPNGVNFRCVGQRATEYVVQSRVVLTLSSCGTASTAFAILGLS
jgi:hypothetical protein